jgi:hypothetical protein
VQLGYMDVGTSGGVPAMRFKFGGHVERPTGG